MPTPLPTREAQQRPARSNPRMDGFGTWISIVVLVASVTAAFVMRQNIDDHIYSVAGIHHAATTGAAVHDH
jgi:hypothetical protein